MEIANLLSDIILIVTGAWIVFQLSRFLFRSVRFLYNALYGDIVLTNPRTGKSVTLGRYHRNGLSQEIQDILD
ncbi:hypothetical protein J2Y45_002362 [Dyadobacter sp. BE34]|uniref:Uncharacterized protein n=1 Tax=Dyadobacter fermentans TaxID=94254 RepID=A0ABU1QXF1_9BACT|nr:MULTISPECIES: hypothetical protein [Dyadobacter]MDR6805329.1 hypothetical protein [Dyadobacter fermentans]MDR7042911.1 hypothetical protein [Dyadobacter sp. BE242]MDR7197223.1 hypothetical protein [Dyadobacter sp. BE34]MDR7215342.1 hypothetical protein [Dyadobacter sp. BE31]MDR7262878.1 hypothetical protein [Dyadobacter sp. BE32]